MLSSMEQFVSVHRSKIGLLKNISYLWHAFLDFPLDSGTDGSLFHAFFPQSVNFFILPWNVRSEE